MAFVSAKKIFLLPVPSFNPAYLHHFMKQGASSHLKVPLSQSPNLSKTVAVALTPLHSKHEVTGIFESYHGHFVAFGPCRLSWLAPFSAQVSSRR